MSINNLHHYSLLEIPLLLLLVGDILLERPLFRLLSPALSTDVSNTNWSTEVWTLLELQLSVGWDLRLLDPGVSVKYSANRAGGGRRLPVGVTTRTDFDGQGLASALGGLPLFLGESDPEGGPRCWCEGLHVSPFWRGLRRFLESSIGYKLYIEIHATERINAS